MVRFVLILALAGCYRPSLVDCADTCKENGLCPDGLSCIGGFCTSGTSCGADAHQNDSWVADVVAQLDAGNTDAEMIDAQMIDAATTADATLDASGSDAGVDAAMIDAVIDAPMDAPMIDAPMIDAPMIDAPMIDAATPDAMVDAQLPDAMIDAPVDAPPDAPNCPALPPTSSSCTATLAPPVWPYCFAVCTNPVTPNVSSGFMSGSWHTAVITSTAEETAAVTALGATGLAWIALDQMGGSPTTPTMGWHWVMQMPSQLVFTAWASSPTQQPDDGGGGGTENHVQDCGAIGPLGWSDESCGTARPFLIEPF